MSQKNTKIECALGIISTIEYMQNRSATKDLLRRLRAFENAEMTPEARKAAIVEAQQMRDLYDGLSISLRVLEMEYAEPIAREQVSAALLSREDREAQCSHDWNENAYCSNCGADGKA